MNPARFAAAWTRLLLATLLSCVAVAAEGAKPTWNITDLGALGSRGSIGLALNNRGDAGGYSKAVPPGMKYDYIHAFLWRDGQMIDLGSQVGTPPGTGNSQVSAINDAGVAVIQGTDGVILYQDGAFTRLGFNASVADINHAGWFVGGYYDGTATHGYVWHDGAMQDLGTLGGTTSSATAINDKGVVVGTSQVAGNAGTRGFVWENGQLTPIPTFGGASSIVADINSHGVVVGSAQDASGAWIAYLYDGKSGLQPIPNWPAGATVFAINDHGVILGDTGRNGFTWDKGTVTYLETLPDVQAKGWSRLFVIDMNDRGDIVGWGWKAGGPIDGEAFLLSPK